MQAIVTKYHGPTDRRGSRVSAKCQAGAITLEWDDALNSDENHAVAAEMLANRLGWLKGSHGQMAHGTLPDGRGAHVFYGRG